MAEYIHYPSLSSVAPSLKLYLYKKRENADYVGKKHSRTKKPQFYSQVSHSVVLIFARFLYKLNKNEE